MIKNTVLRNKLYFLFILQTFINQSSYPLYKKRIYGIKKQSTGDL